MKKLYTLVVIFFVVSVAYSQPTTLSLSSFTDIDVFGPFEIKLVKAETEKAEVDFNRIDREDVVIDVHHGVLRLKFKNRHYMDEWKNENRKTKYISVTLYYKDIDAIEASAGAVVTSTETLKSKYLVLDCDMGAEIKLDLYTEKIEAITNMGGILEMTGKTNRLEVKANMGGVLRATQLESKTAYVKANMGAVVRINVTDELEATSGFGASVEYIGGPSVRHTSRNFGGEVNKRSN